MKRAICLALLALSGIVGCGAEFEDQSKLTSLRVLGVRKDKPYAKPGDSVKLGMLYDDAALVDTDAAVKRRDVQVIWIGACENPEGDLYYNCLPKIAKAFGALLGGGAPREDAGSSGGQPIGLGLEYTYRLSPDIIEKHAPPRDTSPRYGLSYVFFLVCAGNIDKAPQGQQFPLACYSKSGKQLGADDFVVGYTAVYAYEEITNANPSVTGFSVDDKPVDPVCVDDQCIALELGAPTGPGSPHDGGSEAGANDGGSDASTGEAGKPDAGPPGGAQPADPCEDPAAPTCFEVCTAEKQDDCPEHSLKLETNPSSVEKDAVTLAREGRDLSEQAWINYYAEQGQFVNDVKLLGDATNGYQEDHGTKFRTPKKIGPFNVWGVAHDSRGGVSWAQVRLSTRAAK